MLQNLGHYFPVWWMHRTAPKQWDITGLMTARSALFYRQYCDIFWLRLSLGLHGTNGGAVYPTRVALALCYVKQLK
jgi:hypothetical protein